MTAVQMGLTIAVCTAATMLTRFLPFLVLNELLFLNIQMCVFYFELDNLNLMLLKSLFLLHEFQKVVFHQVFLLNRL